MSILLITVVVIVLIASYAMALGVILNKNGILRSWLHPKQIFGLAFFSLACSTLAAVALAFGKNHTAAIVVALVALVGYAVLFSLLMVGRRRSVEKAEHPLTVLAVGAHPDDIELACGGTLAKLADEGYQVNELILSQGRVGGTGDIRIGEAQRGAEFLGAVSVEVLDFPDTYLHDHVSELVVAIEQRISAVKPDLIFTHSYHDAHQDHFAVHEAVMRAARNCSSILCFESPSTTRAFDPSVFSDISDYVELKARAVALHADQSGKPYMSADRVRGIATFRGGQARMYRAEGFESMRMAMGSKRK